MRISVIIPAAGQGKRMNSSLPKQFLLLKDRPILAHTLGVFQKMDMIDEIIVVVGESEQPSVQEIINSYYVTKVSAIVIGGKERQDSVYAGLLAATGDLILVHDGARPLLTTDRVTELIESARVTGASILAVPVKDTVKEVNSTYQVVRTPERKSLWAVQTPQAFRYDLLQRAFQKAKKDNFLGTDESSLVERLGINVSVVMGHYENLKITTPEDIDIADAILSRRGR